MSVTNHSQVTEMFDGAAYNSELGTSVSLQGQEASGDLVAEAAVALVKKITNCYLLPLIGVLGIVGNVLSLVVLAAQERQQPMNIPLMGLAVSGMAYLFTRKLSDLLSNICRSNIDLGGCILKDTDAQAADDFYTITQAHALWLSVLFSRITNALTASIAWGRCLVVWYPLKARAWVTTRALCVTTSAIYVTTTIAHVPLFLRNEVIWVQLETAINGQKTNVTVARLQPTAFSIENRYWLGTYKDMLLNVLFRLLPMVVVSFCTALILLSLKRQQQWRLTALAASGGSGGKSHVMREARLTITMVWLCCVFIVCSFPGLCLFTARLVKPEFDFYGTFSNVFEITTASNSVLEAINSAVFLVYVATGDNFLKKCKRSFLTLHTAASCCHRPEPRSEIAICTSNALPANEMFAGNR